MYKGIFWLVDDRLITVKVLCDAAGCAREPCVYSSKSEQNFNHKIEWERLPHTITGGKTYAFYPRGRVEIKRGKATIWLNPSLMTAERIAAVKREFDLSAEPIPIIIKPDGSKHYEYGKE